MRKIQILFILAIVLFCSACGNKKSVNEPDEPGVENQHAQSAETEKTEKTEQPEKTATPVNTEIDWEYDGYYYSGASEGRDNISVPCWNGNALRFYLNVMPFDGGTSFGDYGPLSGYETNDLDMDKIIEMNKEYFTGKGEYKDNEGKTYDALHFFSDDNAYVLYKSGRSVNLQNRMIWDEIDNSFKDLFEEEEGYTVKVPFPVCVEICDYKVKESWDVGTKWEEDNIFSICTFEEAKEFYNMFSEGTASIDDENEIIRVQGQMVAEMKKNESVVAVFDFKNKTYEVQYEDGTVFHSLQTLYDVIEKQYTSAGKIDGKEVIYNDNMFVVENGKRTMLLNKLGMDGVIEEIPGYNCVGEECIFKLTKIKGDKYYFDVKATLVEDEEWTLEYTLVVENMKYKLKAK